MSQGTSGLLTHNLLFFPPNPILTIQFLLSRSTSRLLGSEVEDKLSPRMLKRSNYSRSLFHSWSHKATDDSYLTAKYSHLFSSQLPTLHSNMEVHFRLSLRDKWSHTWLVMLATFPLVISCLQFLCRGCCTGRENN